MAGYNLPDGVTGGEDYFNPPDAPECRECCADIEDEWLYCPWCGAQLHPEEWIGGEWVGPQMYDCARDYEVDRALDGD